MPHSGSLGQRGVRGRMASMATTLAVGLILVACVGPSTSETPRASATPTPLATPSVTVGVSASPTATATPPLSLSLPAALDRRRIRVSVRPTIPASGTGHLTIKVMNLASTRVSELVLRWPTPLDRIVFLAPFQPSPGRLTDALIQPWTKWVIGPGEQGEPAGTTSLGWGPLDPGATLNISLIATRRARGPVAFDLQLLAGEALLTTDAGAPAETRVSIP